MADLLPFGDALWIAEKAASMLHGQTYSVDTSTVLKLVQQTHHSSYDCEYVALAEALGIPLITGDQRLAQLFPNRVVLMEDFAT